MSPVSALAVTVAAAVVIFVLALIVVWMSDRLDRRDRARREAETRRIVREELDR